MATTDGEKAGAKDVSEEAPSQELQHEQHHHFKHLEVRPIQEEAVDNAVHIDLSWRSWVRISARPMLNHLSPGKGLRARSSTRARKLELGAKVKTDMKKNSW